MLEYDTKFQPATDTQVREIEKLLGHKLPADFADFLLNKGGGYYVEPSLFEIPGEGEGNIKTFYGISDESFNDIRHAIRMTHTYPKGFLLVAVDFFGNRVVLGLRWLKKGPLRCFKWVTGRVVEAGDGRL